MVPPVNNRGKVRTGSDDHEHHHHDGHRTMRRECRPARIPAKRSCEGSPGFPGAPRSIEYPYAATYFLSHAELGRCVE